MATQSASAPAIVSLDAALAAIAAQHHLTTEGATCVSKRRAAALYRLGVADPAKFVQSCATHEPAPTYVVVKVFRAVGERDGAAEVRAAAWVERLRATTDCTMVARYYFYAHKASFVSPSTPAASLTYIIMECGGSWRDRYMLDRHQVGQLRVDQQPAAFAALNHSTVEHAARLVGQLRRLYQSPQGSMLVGDVKPSNVCIDDAGNFKLIDLGGATVHQARASTHTAHLEHDHQSPLLTWEYAAPEQHLRNSAGNVMSIVSWPAQLFHFGAAIISMMTSNVHIPTPPATKIDTLRILFAGLEQWQEAGYIYSQDRAWLLELVHYDPSTPLSAADADGPEHRTAHPSAAELTDRTQARAFETAKQSQAMLLATGLASKIEYSSNKLRRETVDANLAATTKAIVEAIKADYSKPDADLVQADAMREVFVRRLGAAGLALRSIANSLDKAAAAVADAATPHFRRG